MSQAIGATADGVPGAPAGRPTNGRLLVLYPSLGGLAFAVLQSLVAPAMSTIARDLNVSTADASWILTAYLLSASVLTPVLGRLGDMIGKRRLGMRESPVRKPGRLDVLGTAILSISLVSLLLAISKGQAWGWASASTVSLLAVGVVTMILFVVVELRVGEPLVDMRLMKIRGVWATDLVALILGFAMFGSFLLVPTLLQLPAATGYGYGKSVSEAGLFLLPTVVSMVLFGPLAGLLVRRFGPKLPMFLGAVAVVGGFTLPAAVHNVEWQVIVSGLLVGAGIGLAFAAMSNAIIEIVPATQTGEATSVNTIARTIGSSVGSAVVAAVSTTCAAGRGVGGLVGVSPAAPRMSMPIGHAVSGRQRRRWEEPQWCGWECGDGYASGSTARWTAAPPPSSAGWVWRHWP